MVNILICLEATDLATVHNLHSMPLQLDNNAREVLNIITATYDDSYDEDFDGYMRDSEMLRIVGVKVEYYEKKQRMMII